jgi:hypothetical protein
VNLICEHCLVSAFVDQQNTVGAEMVDAVARDFDLGDNTTSQVLTTPPQTSSAEKFDLVEALRTLATLADRLRHSDQELAKERKL